MACPINSSRARYALAQSKSAIESLMNKSEFLDTLQTVRAQWEELLAEVGKARMQEPGVAGEWSVKDIIAHVTWPEREMAAILQARSLVAGSELWDLPQDELNAVVVAQN